MLFAVLLFVCLAFELLAISLLCPLLLCDQANRLGVTTVISTDSIRHMLRSFQPKEEAPLLWASTYQAGEALNHLDKGAAGGEVGGELMQYRVVLN
jgi:hypothetical protein